MAVAVEVAVAVDIEVEVAVEAFIYWRAGSRSLIHSNDKTYVY